jgi:hypothetical protein
MGNMDVTARLLADNAQFDAAMNKSASTATATGVATEKATKRAADATKFAAQFATDAIQKSTDSQVSSMLKLRAAQEDYARAQKIVRAGYLDSATGAQTLGAALQRLTAAQNVAAESQLRMAAANKETGKGFQDVAERVVLSSVGYIAAATGIRDIFGSMKEAVTSSLEFGESIERASQKTNLSVQTLSMLHYAAAVTGGDFDSLSKGVGKLDVSIAEAANGNKEMAAYFSALGLNAKQLAVESNGTQIAVQRLAAAMANTSGPEKQLIAQKLLSRAGVEQIPTLMKLGENWDQYTQAARNAGVLLDSGTAESLEATNERLRAMEQRIDGAKLAFTEGLTKGLNQFANTLQGGGVQISLFTKLAEGLTKQLNFGAAAAFSFGASLDTIRAYTWDLGVKKDRDADLSASSRQRAKAEQFDKNARGGDPTPKEVAPASSTATGKPPLHVVDPAVVAAAEAAARKAAEARLKGMEAELAEMKQQNSVTIQAEYQFWQDRISAFKKGSDQYNAIVEKESQLAVEGAKAAHEMLTRGMKQVRETANLSPDDANRGIAENSEQMTKLAENISSTGERWKAYNSEIAKNAELLIKSTQAMREAQLEHGVKAGTVSKADAAQQMGQIHSQSEAMEIAELRAQLAEVQEQQAKLNPYTKEGSEDAPRLGEQAKSLQNQIDSTTASANLQAIKDQYAAFAETGLGGAVSALQAFTAASMDSASQMKQITDTVLNDTNRAILTDLTGNRQQRRGAWTNAGKGIFTDVADQSLKKGEGSLLGALGIGKLGSRGNPMFVKSVDSMPDAAGLGRSLFGAKGPVMPPVSAIPAAASAAASSTSWLGGILKVFAGLLPHFADGGDVSAGTMAMVGERGPEPVLFGQSARVIPNHKMNAMGGGTGDTHHTWNIDARGSSNPAQTMAMVQQGIMEAAPHIVAASLKAHNDQNSRLPPTARK